VRPNTLGKMVVCGSEREGVEELKGYHVIGGVVEMLVSAGRMVLTVLGSLRGAPGLCRRILSFPGADRSGRVCRLNDPYHHAAEADQLEGNLVSCLDPVGLRKKLPALQDSGLSL
jgi:hypothetical protein